MCYCRSIVCCPSILEEQSMTLQRALPTHRPRLARVAARPVVQVLRALCRRARGRHRRHARCSILAAAAAVQLLGKDRRLASVEV
eukprot:30935-Chlamydomonas_euryale.AAC.1